MSRLSAGSEEGVNIHSLHTYMYFDHWPSLCLTDGEGGAGGVNVEKRFIIAVGGHLGNNSCRLPLHWQCFLFCGRQERNVISYRNYLLKIESSLSV